MDVEVNIKIMNVILYVSMCINIFFDKGNSLREVFFMNWMVLLNVLKWIVLFLFVYFNLSLI